ncbi:MAG: non-heme iron oxygenase ferredoxin subunit [Thaumarchaeota archaeon]|nr:non-heme iron oxygenase ferredoxin subunit [Nitrososphaerota archaeon]MCY3976253.1 non-heme iron oxygenase ferredoxin subunit [Nitrososphaerota archaeon]
MNNWIKVCTKSELDDKKLLRFDYHEKKILITKLNNTIYAIDSICTHADADLSEGFINSEGIRCPLHLSIFDLETGIPQNPPAEKPLNTYNVKIEQNIIYVDIKN